MTGSDLVDIIIPPPSSSPSPKQAFVDHLHSTAVFADNQLIHSWAKRHLRPHPLTLPGDLDLGLNPDQLRALALSLHSRLSVIQGVRIAR